MLFALAKSYLKGSVCLLVGLESETFSTAVTIDIIAAQKNLLLLFFNLMSNLLFFNENLKEKVHVEQHMDLK